VINSAICQQTDKAKNLNTIIFTKEKSGILSTNSEPKSQQLQWRRSKVIELRSRGLSQIEIARELQVSEASISSDIQYLREQAKGTIREYIILLMLQWCAVLCQNHSVDDGTIL
jgi:DNA-binding NarL/FixJ family response regulator